MYFYSIRNSGLRFDQIKSSNPRKLLVIRGSKIFDLEKYAWKF